LPPLGPLRHRLDNLAFTHRARLRLRLHLEPRFSSNRFSAIARSIDCVSRNSRASAVSVHVTSIFIRSISWRSSRSDTRKNSLRGFTLFTWPDKLLMERVLQGRRILARNERVHVELERHARVAELAHTIERL